MSRPEVWRDEFDGGWGAADPDLPGCISQGETEAEALANLAEARREIEAVLTTGAQ